MFKTSYLVIISGILAMIVASIFIYLEMFRTVAFALLVYGFFAIGIGILLGFFKMVSDDG